MGRSERPTRDETLMTQAQIIAERSTCSRASVGVVIAQDARVVSQGYNGAPAGMPHCDHTCDCGFPGEGGLLFEGKHLSNCAKTSACTAAVHAEANAIAFAAKHGVATGGAHLFTTLAPCLPCSQLIINAGIVRVVYFVAYRERTGISLLASANIEVWHGTGFIKR